MTAPSWDRAIFFLAYERTGAKPPTWLAGWLIRPRRSISWSGQEKSILPIVYEHLGGVSLRGLIWHYFSILISILYRPTSAMWILTKAGFTPWTSTSRTSPMPRSFDRPSTRSWLLFDEDNNIFFNNNSSSISSNRNNHNKSFRNTHRVWTSTSLRQRHPLLFALP